MLVNARQKSLQRMRNPGLQKKTPSIGSLLSVGVERFELSTSRTRTVRSTGLSHTPMYNSGIRKRANYTIPICFCKKLRVQQHFLAVNIEQSLDAVIVLINS